MQQSSYVICYPTCLRLIGSGKLIFGKKKVVKIQTRRNVTHYQLDSAKMKKVALL